MDYKKIIRSRRLRIKIMQFLSFFPDSLMIKAQYRVKTGRKLNLNNPQRYTEKLQWYKIHYKNPTMKQCVDKHEVREYVRQKGLASILNETYGVYESFEEIDFSRLPDKIVIKDTLGGGSVSVIVFDQKKDDYIQLKEMCDRWVSEPMKSKHPGREWPYDETKHRIVIERYLEQQNGDLADYKFYCFNGKVACFYIRTDYLKMHDNAKMAFFDREGQLLEGVGMDYCAPSKEAPAIPDNLGQMIKYAELLSREFPHVRVDFYNVDGEIFFGELTFYNASGYMAFIPDSFDFDLGSIFELEEFAYE